MEMIYDRLNSDELRGTTQADYLIAFDADLRVVAGNETVYDEPSFPVVELARSLLIWLGNPDRGDFEFDSMSFEDVGSIAFRQTPAGWAFGAAFDPGASTAPIDWTEVVSCCRHLISRVEVDLAALGLDPAEVLRR
jgi:hypothetical protein